MCLLKIRNTFDPPLHAGEGEEITLWKFFTADFYSDDASLYGPYFHQYEACLRDTWMKADQSSSVYCKKKTYKAGFHGFLNKEDARTWVENNLTEFDADNRECGVLIPIKARGIYVEGPQLGVINDANQDDPECYVFSEMLIPKEIPEDAEWFDLPEPEYDEDDWDDDGEEEEEEDKEDKEDA